MKIKKITKTILSFLLILMVTAILIPESSYAATVPKKCPKCGAQYMCKKTISYSANKKYSQRKWDITSGQKENYSSRQKTFGSIKVKSVTTEFQCGGGISFSLFSKFLTASVSANYKKTVQTVSGGYTSLTLPAHTYGAIYLGSFYDVYNIKKTETIKCNKCKRTINIARSTYTAKVPLKECEGETTKTNSKVLKMIKKKDKKGNVYWAVNQCLPKTFYETIY